MGSGIVMSTSIIFKNYIFVILFYTLIYIITSKRAVKHFLGQRMRAAWLSKERTCHNGRTMGHLSLPFRKEIIYFP